MPKAPKTKKEKLYTYRGGYQYYVHLYRGSARCREQAPNREIVLHAPEGLSADDIQRTYTVDEEAALRDFIGQPATGDWRLGIIRQRLCLA